MLSKTHTSHLKHLHLCFFYKGWWLLQGWVGVTNKAPQKARRMPSMSEARPPLSEWQHQSSGNQWASLTAGKTLTTYTHSQISGIPHVADYKDGHAGIPVMTVHTQAYMPLLPHDWSLLPTNNTLLRPAINTSTDSDKPHPHRGKHSAIYFMTSDFFFLLVTGSCCVLTKQSLRLPSLSRDFSSAWECHEQRILLCCYMTGLSMCVTSLETACIYSWRLPVQVAGLISLSTVLPGCPLPHLVLHTVIRTIVPLIGTSSLTQVNNTLTHTQCFNKRTDTSIYKCPRICKGFKKA